MVDEVEPRIRELLAVYPTMAATVIAERIGWTRSIRTLSGRVAQLRPVHLPPDPAGRTSYEAIKSTATDDQASGGIIGQCLALIEVDGADTYALSQ